MKVWEINKTKGVWTIPDITVTIEGIDKMIPLATAMKQWNNLSDMVLAHANAMKGTFHVYVNGQELAQDEAELPIASVKTLVISTKALDEPKTLDKVIKEAEEKVAKKMPKPVRYADKTKEKSSHAKNHIHEGIVGYHLKTDKHKNPVAQKVHDILMKSEE